MSSQFEQLAKHTVIVADTGDIEAIKKFKPTDATTNPSLLLKAAQQKQYAHLVDDAVKFASGIKDPKLRLEATMDKLAVNFGAEIAKIVPGVVSTEIDARLSFDTEACVRKAHQIIQLYKSMGVGKERILIKIASTWEGIKAAEILEKQGIKCNMTLLFSMSQAIACAEAKATLISPFVGRILDWFVSNTKTKTYTPGADPGVQSVTAIYKYYKSIDCTTVVMGASFRNKGEILELAGCDKLTISPELLTELKNSSESVVRKLSGEVKADPSKAVHLDEKAFRWMLNEDQMATEKLSDGIRRFAADTVALEKVILAKIQKQSKL